MKTNIIAKGIAILVMLSVFLAPLAAQQAQTKPGEKININTASADVLDKLPRIGPKVALRIIDFRKQNGPFKKVEELMKVKGIGEKTFAKLKDLITI
jgi:competence protein ComEA